MRAGEGDDFGIHKACFTRRRHDLDVLEHRFLTFARDNPDAAGRLEPASQLGKTHQVVNSVRFVEDEVGLGDGPATRLADAITEAES